MERYQFTKMSGAGNDFIVLDNRDGKVPEEGRRGLIEAWAARRVGIGADGVLLVENPEGPNADFRMRYYNADGGEAESCGNGARCIARFAHLIGAAEKKMSFETKAGIYRAEVVGEEIRLTMSDPHTLRRDVAVDLPGIPGGKVDYINTGVPHAVIFTDDLKSVPVDELGRKIRFHAAFAPAGTNVNWAQVVGPDKIAVRTYERGVEGETLACGTGSVAVALIAYLKGLAKSPTAIVTSGGPVLKIYFDPKDGGFTNVRLEGEARVVYEGVVTAAAAKQAASV
ncbi:diaminopimelate epimerase [Candidatus Sumerlaeota bacterium]|nr:diaminopimelate epimerase [Candidatus Sumerlaeota bacterium]